MAKRWRIAPDLQKLSNVGLTLGQRRHPDRENTNHYTTLAQQQHADRDHTNHYTTLAQRDIASWEHNKCKWMTHTLLTNIKKKSLNSMKPETYTYTVKEAELNIKVKEVRS